MKINYLCGSIAIRQCDGYTENLEFNVTETKGLTFRYPYGEATPEEAEAISQFVKTVTNAYNKLTTQIDGVNRDLHLEQYAPVVSSEDTSSESTVAPTDEPPVGTTQTESIGAECEIKDAPFEDPERPFGLSEEQIAVLKANKGVTDEDIFGE